MCRAWRDEECICRHMHLQEKDTEPFEAGVTDGCEQPDVSAGT